VDARLGELITHYQRSRGASAGAPPGGFTLAELEPFALASPELYPEYTAVVSRLGTDLVAAEEAGEIRRGRDERGAERLYLRRDWPPRAT
jgi:hypothetical protein